MNTTRFARYFALPIVSAGIIGGAALGLAGAANAANNADVRPPDIVATPDVKAHPAPEAMPGCALAPRDLPGRGPAAGLHPLINITEALPEELGEGLGAMGRSMRIGVVFPQTELGGDASAVPNA